LVNLLATPLILLRPGLSLTALFVSDVVSRMIQALFNWRRFAIIARTAFGLVTLCEVRRVFSYCRWITISCGIGALQNYVPTVSLGRAGAKTEMAIYGLGAAFSSTIGMLLTAAGMIFLPAASCTRTDQERRRYLTSSVPVAAALGIGMVAAIAALMPIVRVMVPQRYAPALWVFVVLSATQALLVCSNTIQYLLYSYDRADLCTLSDVAIAGAYFAVMVAMRGEPKAINLACALFGATLLVKFVTSVSICRHVLGWSYRSELREATAAE
jgi:O-antigen/teichoic acid export membrane protein